MAYTLIGLGALAYLGLGVGTLVRSWRSSRRAFRPGSPLEPLVVVLWPALPGLWWPRRRRRCPAKPPAARAAGPSR